MCVIAALECDMQCARDDTIVGKRALAGQQPSILDSLDPRADVLRPQPEAEIRAFEPQCLPAIVSHRKSDPFPFARSIESVESSGAMNRQRGRQKEMVRWAS
jgi:hypothetical protein